MELLFLKKFEGRKVKIVLKNNFTYTDILFKINSDGLIEFKDRTGEEVSIQPDFISMISKINSKIIK